MGKDSPYQIPDPKSNEEVNPNKIYVTAGSKPPDSNKCEDCGYLCPKKFVCNKNPTVFQEREKNGGGIVPHSDDWKRVM